MNENMINTAAETTATTNSAKKLIFVPRNWGINYTDATGNDVSIMLAAPEEYEITKADGTTVYCTVKEVVRENNDESGNRKVFIKPAFLMLPGYTHVIERNENIMIDVDDIVSIKNVKSVYSRASRHSKDISEEFEESFTFAFDVDGYDKRYRITIGSGEFVALSVKDNRRGGDARKTIYGEVYGVDEDDNVLFVRYLSHKGVRYDRPNYKVALSDLLGIYRYELQFMDAAEAKAAKEAAARSKNEEVEEAENNASESEEHCESCAVPENQG